MDNIYAIRVTAKVGKQLTIHIESFDSTESLIGLRVDVGKQKWGMENALGEVKMRPFGSKAEYPTESNADYILTVLNTKDFHYSHQLAEALESLGRAVAQRHLRACAEAANK